MHETEQAREAYIAARDHMNALHEEFLAVLGTDANVTEARLAFDCAERRMMRLRRAWWIALAWERQNHATGRD